MIFKNEKEKGIKELYLAADSSLLFRNAARSALIWVWLNEKRYDSVIVIAREFVAKYPDSKAFLWPLAQAYVETRQYRAALEVYQNLRERLVHAPGNYFNLIEVDCRMARCYERLRMTEKATIAAGRVNDYDQSIPQETRRRQRANLKYMRRLARL
jgi:predicted Zn-dependent protease